MFLAAFPAALNFSFPTFFPFTMKLVPKTTLYRCAPYSLTYITTATNTPMKFPPAFLQPVLFLCFQPSLFF